MTLKGTGWRSTNKIITNPLTQKYCFVRKIALGMISARLKIPLSRF